jgi:hypothetical protein
MGKKGFKKFQQLEHLFAFILRNTAGKFALIIKGFVNIHTFPSQSPEAKFLVPDRGI